MLIAAATVGNAMAGVRFARGRTDYVRGLEDQIITSAALPSGLRAVGQGGRPLPDLGQRVRFGLLDSERAGRPGPPQLAA